MTGSWSRNILTCDIIECPQPRAPSGGRVSGYNREIHSKIEYSCLPGHVLEGEAMVTCTSSGLWSNRAPSCRYVDCGQVPNLGLVSLSRKSFKLNPFKNHPIDLQLIFERSSLRSRF